MSSPQCRSQHAQRLVAEVETSPGSGRFVVDPQLRVEQVEVGSDERIGRALLSVKMDGPMAGLQTRSMYHPQLRLTVRIKEPTANGGRILFDGYAPVQEWRWEGQAGQSRAEHRFWAEHVVERLARDRTCQIVGRRVRTGQIEDGLAADPQSWADKSALITALPCIFNLDGCGNCDPKPLIVSAADGGARLVHIFCDDGDPKGVPWTLGRVLRYLLYAYLPRGGPVSGDALLKATEVWAESGLGGREPAKADVLGTALRREPVSLTCEATNVVEALLLVADEAGCHLGAETTESHGRRTTQLTFWSPREGRAKWLYLARGGRKADGTARYPTGSRSASEVFAESNVSAGRVTVDWRDVGCGPLIVGGVKKYEMTVPLVPGWVPLAGLDNVAESDREAAKADALLPGDVPRLGSSIQQMVWFMRQHRLGPLHRTYSDAARRWVLNEHGSYDPASYNRNAPFDSYEPFDFATVCDAAVAKPGSWMRRSRRLLPTISRSGGPGRKVWVEISFDGGQTWHLQSSGVQVLTKECGIFLDCENPCEVTPPGVWPDEQNLWYAIIDQTCRVRVTAVIESDERLWVEGETCEAGATVLFVSRELVYRPAHFGYVSPAHTANVLVGDEGTVQDDTQAMIALAARLGDDGSASAVQGWPVVPWMDDHYEVGDRIGGVWGQGVWFGRDGLDDGLPNVLGKVYRAPGGRYETELVLG